MKEYGHDQDLKRTNNTLKLVNNLLDNWTELAPKGASHVNQMKHTLESLKDGLENKHCIINISELKALLNNPSNNPQMTVMNQNYNASTTSLPLEN